MLSSSCSIWTTLGISSNMLTCPTYDSPISDISPKAPPLLNTWKGLAGRDLGQWMEMVLSCLGGWFVLWWWLFALLCALLFCVWVHILWHVEVRGCLVRISSFFPTCGFWESNSGWQDGWQVFFPTESSCQAWWQFWLWCFVWYSSQSISGQENLERGVLEHLKSSAVTTNNH